MLLIIDKFLLLGDNMYADQLSSNQNSGEIITYESLKISSTAAVGQDISNKQGNPLETDRNTK